MQDEIYVKKMSLYRRGLCLDKQLMILNPLQKTVLGVLISCMFGGPTLISKILPIAKLNSLNFFMNKKDLKLMSSINHRV